MGHVNMDWIHLVQDKFEWWGYVTLGMNLQVL